MSKDFPRVRVTHLAKMDKSSAHYIDAVNRPFSSKAFFIGSLIHTMVLEPEALPERYLRATKDQRTKAGKEEKAEATARGLLLVGAKDWTNAENVAAAVMGHSLAQELLEGTYKETSLEWREGATGIECRGRVDAWNARVLVDLKTCQDIFFFQRDIFKYLYHIKMAWYRYALEILHPTTPPREVYLIAVQKTPPYPVGVFRLSAPLLAAGDVRWRAWLQQLAECRASGHWPGPFDSRVVDVEL